MVEQSFELKEMSAVMEQVLGSGGEFRFFPRGTSMLPLIRQNIDSIALTSAPEKLKKHDIPLYRRDNGQFVLHRIVSSNPDGTYNMCGDNQITVERGIRREQIIGVVTAIFRNGNRVNVTAMSYRLYSSVWGVMPIRRCGLLFKRAIGKVFRKKWG